MPTTATLPAVSGIGASVPQLPAVELYEAVRAELAPLSATQKKTAEDKATALAEYLRRQEGHTAAARHHAKCALIAARAVAEEVATKRPKGRRGKCGARPTISEVELDRYQRAAYRRMLEVPQDEFLAYLDKDEWPSRRGVERLRLQLRQKAKPTPPPPKFADPDLERINRSLQNAKRIAKRRETQVKGEKAALLRDVLQVVEELEHALTLGMHEFLTGTRERRKELR